MKKNLVLTNRGERGAALVVALLTMALLLALVMGISLTAISEVGVSNTYGTQTIALQCAEGGLNHAASLVQNYQGVDFTQLLGERGADFNTNYLEGNNPFVAANASRFAPGVEMITDEDPRGYQLRDANGIPVPDAFYRVHLIDDEPQTSTTLPKVPNFNPGVSYGESTGDNPNNANIDQNNRIVIYSTGTYSNASVTIEGWVAFLPYPAMLAQGDITVWGNSAVTGQFGSVHSNSNLAVGGSANIQQTATATGTLTISNNATIGGFAGGGQPPIYIPRFVTTAPLSPGGPQTTPRLQDYIIQTADRLLIDPGWADGAARGNNGQGQGNGSRLVATQRLRALADRLNTDYESLARALDSDGDLNNGVQQVSEAAASISRNAGTGAGTGNGMTVASTGWAYVGGNDSRWHVPPDSSGTANGHTWYVIGLDNYNLGNPSASTPNGGNVKIDNSSSGGSGAFRTTILSTGSVWINGNRDLTANLRSLSTPEMPPFVRIDLLIAAVEDVKINGNVDAAQNFNGIIYAGEQTDLSGNGRFEGQVISLSNQDVSGSIVPANLVSGNFRLEFNAGAALGKIALYGWRQIKR
ncbi:MAG TPA: hypothetical protein VJH03_01645 [Blastocatellia bacterium]|nr:hypothetical protein [Blastocatellia bacterium]